MNKPYILKILRHHKDGLECAKDALDRVEGKVNARYNNLKKEIKDTKEAIREIKLLRP